MGAGASATSMRAEIDRLRQRELNTTEENLKEWDKKETKVTARLSQLQSERNDLAQRLAKAEQSLAHQREGWRKERDKTMALTYSGLPLSLLSEGDKDLLERKPNLSITKNFPMVTIAQSDVVGFSRLVTSLKPQEVIRIIDHLHALSDEAYASEEIFIMERSSDGCTAVAGLCDALMEEKTLSDGSISSISLTDSSYGSQPNLLDDVDRNVRSAHKKASEIPNISSTAPRDLKPASYYAGQLATAVLNLMSTSSRINVPLNGRKQLQLRVSLHSGPCMAGVQGLQTSAGYNRIPQFKLIGPTTTHASTLCQTGLALQIRVSRSCKDLLTQAGGFLFERCPDYSASASGKPVESYWLVGKQGLNLSLPSLDLAIPLSEYDDAVI